MSKPPQHRIARAGGAASPARRTRGPAVAAFLCALCLGAPVPGQSTDVLAKLNADGTIHGTEESKSYRVLLDAYLKLTPPPEPVSDAFNLATIHPGMKNWTKVSDWAESNPHMAEAILACRSTNILGLPYGTAAIEEKYRTANLVAVIGVEEDLEVNDFRYLRAMDAIAAYATAEMYRRLLAGEQQPAIDLATALNWVLRQLCDRQFLQEKVFSINLLVDALVNLLDVLYSYQDKFTAEQFRQLSWEDIPQLRPDRNRLHMPEGDRVVSEALLEAVFGSDSQPDPELFARAFGSIQSYEAPLTRFGAARRWRMIAAVHGSLEASKERLELIYHDWWRRWRVQEYDPILAIPTQFARTNPIRYAAVMYSIEDLEEAFAMRSRLVTAVNGTAIAAGLCAYKATFGVYPDDKEKLYGQFVRRRISDIDPYDQQFGPLHYRLLDARTSLDTRWGRLWLDKGQCILYSVGADHADGRAVEHVGDASAGDLVIWPPIRTLLRQQKLVE